MLCELPRLRTFCFAMMVITAWGCSRNESPPRPNAARTTLPVPSEEILPPVEPDSLAYPSTQQWQEARPRQKARAERSFALLKAREIPVYNGPLFVEDDEEVRLQDPQQVARRAIILWAIALRAEATPQPEVMQLIETANAWDSVSPIERQFLESPNPAPEQSQVLMWRLESLWVMLWALGHVEQLEWPSDMCNVPRVVEIMRLQESNPAFIAEAKLRSVAEILDAQDLTMRIHWAIREASLREPPRVPQRLDWSSQDSWVPVPQCPGVGVVEERHYALNWLVRFLSPKDWDQVDTPT